MNPHPICPLLMQTLTQENNTDYILENTKTLASHDWLQSSKMEEKQKYKSRSGGV